MTLANALTEEAAVQVGQVSTMLNVNYSNAATHNLRSTSYQRAAANTVRLFAGNAAPDDQEVVTIGS
ncbi:MAG: hypothetical protein F4Z29_07490 [Gemmatimonadetes bacterium]|nr:hypothetical protein [Gemmatimonadota bacterium]